MTKANMIETLVLDAARRWTILQFMKKLHGKEAKIISDYRNEWSQSFDMVDKLGLTNLYWKKLDED